MSSEQAPRHTSHSVVVSLLERVRRRSKEPDKAKAAEHEHEQDTTIAVSVPVKNHEQDTPIAVSVPAENQPSDRVLTIENLAKVGGAALLMCYAIGLLIVNSYLLPYGVSDFNLFRARFIFTGLLAVATVIVSTAFSLLAITVLIYAPLSTTDVGRSRLSKIGSMIGDLFLSIILLGIPFIVFWFVFGQGWVASIEGYVLNAVLGYILLLIVAVLRFRAKRLRSSKPDNADADDIKGKATQLPDWAMLGLTIALFVIPYIVIVTVYFAANVFPNVPAQLGGARGQTIQLLIKHDSAQGVRDLGVPMKANVDMTDELRLLFTGEDFYLVQSRTGHRKVFVLNAGIVLGINPERSG